MRHPLRWCMRHALSSPSMSGFTICCVMSCRPGPVLLAKVDSAAPTACSPAVAPGTFSTVVLPVTVKAQDRCSIGGGVAKCFLYRVSRAFGRLVLPDAEHCPTGLAQ